MFYLVLNQKYNRSKSITQISGKLSFTAFPET